MTAPLTVLTWLWQQPDGMTVYSADWVNTWAAMIRRHLTLPHRLVCVTDTPQGIDPAVEIVPPFGHFEDVRVPWWDGAAPRCWRRLALFDPAVEDVLGPRFVSMDLDCVVGASLDPVFDRPEDIVMTPGTRPGRYYNGSMLLLRAGSRASVFEEFTAEKAFDASLRFMGSDQAWLQDHLGPGEATWTEADGVRFWNRHRPPVEGETRIMFTAGRCKPLGVALESEWVRRHYRLYDLPPAPAGGARRRGLMV